MKDSCRARKLEPGFAAQYSMSSVFRTSTMKSEPGFSLPVTSAGARGSAGSVGLACCADMMGAVTKPAALTAAPFKKPRRPTGFLLFDIAVLHSYFETGSDARY